MSPLKETAFRRQQHRERAFALLQAIANGTGDVYDCYRGLHAIWCSINSAVPELRPLFRIPGVEPDGQLSVNAAFREEVRALAVRILPLFKETEMSPR